MRNNKPYVMILAVGVAAWGAVAGLYAVREFSARKSAEAVARVSAENRAIDEVVRQTSYSRDQYRVRQAVREKDGWVIFFGNDPPQLPGDGFFVDVPDEGRVMIHWGK